jgi:hypothetical protein
VALQQLRQLLFKARVLKFPGRDIDADPDWQAGALPGGGQGQGGVENPGSKAGDFGLIDDQWQPVIRRQQAPFRVLPANQCLGTTHLATAKIQHRLHKQTQITGADR